MKNNNILTIILTLIVGISIGIFGLSFYQSLNNTDYNKPQQENGDNNQNDQGTNNNENDQVINVTMKEANKLFENTINFAPINVLQALETTNKKSLTVDEIDANYLAYMLFDTNKLEKAQICGTEHETNLKKLNIIGEIGAGQYDCKSEIFYTIDSVKETSKEIFGKELTQFTAAIDKNSGYYYYANGNIAIIRYAGLLGTTYTMTDFYVKDSTLSIEVSSSTNESYKLNFKVDGENFYFASIHKI